MKNLGAVTRSILVFFYRNLLAFAHPNPPKHYLEDKERKTSVIILPGLGQRWALIKPLGDYISLRGHPIYVVPSLRYNLKDIPTSAEIVRGVIDKSNLKHLIIIGHSKGGLIGKYLLANLNKDNRIKGLIAIATPFSGSEITRFVPIKIFKELHPTSNIIQELNSNSSVNSRIVSIYPIFDGAILAKEGSFLKGARNNIQLNVKGHQRILHDKQAFEKVIQYIDELS